MEKKILDTVYCKTRIGYDIMCLRLSTTTDRGVKGGVGIVTRERTEVWDIDYTCFHGPNVASF